MEGGDGQVGWGGIALIWLFWRENVVRGAREKSNAETRRSQRFAEETGRWVRTSGAEALFVTHLYVAAKAATYNDLKRTKAEKSAGEGSHGLKLFFYLKNAFSRLGLRTEFAEAGKGRRDSEERAKTGRQRELTQGELEAASS